MHFSATARWRRINHLSVTLVPIMLMASTAFAQSIQGTATSRRSKRSSQKSVGPIARARR